MADELIPGTEQPIVLPGRMLLSELFVDPTEREQIVREGIVRGRFRDVHVKTRALENGDHEVMSIAAVSRNPGRSDSYLDGIEDLQSLTGSQAQKVQRYWRVAQNHGLTATAIAKISAILSANGTFRVRRAKKGKARTAREQLEELLFEWTRRVNAGVLVGPTQKQEQPGVITGSRGLKALNHQAVRYALVEGSWVGRQVWATTQLGSLGSFDLPMTIQTISTENLEPVQEVKGTGIELFYWRPPQQLVNQLRSPTNKDVGKLVSKFIPKDLQGPLKKDGKVLLDPALLMHVRHRGKDTEAFGESFVHPALPAIAYQQAVLQLDLVSMQSLINRLVIVTVGSSDPKSPYSKPDVATARAAAMQTFFDDPGPNMTIIWQGDDVDTIEIGAHSALVDLESRFGIAEQMIKQALGVPDALLTGTTSDGKAAGWAATIGAAAQLEELANQLAGVWSELGERIALENNFTDIEIVYEWDRQLLIDRIEERNQNRLDYQSGLMDLWNAIAGTGKDPQAVFERRCFEKGLDPNEETVTWERVFFPPQGLSGQGAAPTHNPEEGEPGHDPNLPPGVPSDTPAPPPGQGKGKEPGKGRKPNSESGKTGPERKTKPTTRENK